MPKWLKLFEYKEALSPIPFILSALVIVITAAITSAYYATRAALTSPATTLKTE